MDEKPASSPERQAFLKRCAFDTRLLRAGEDPFPATNRSLRPPIYQTKSFAYDTFDEMLANHYYYSRTENPTLYALDEKLAVLHGGEAAISVASGMAAVNLACLSCIQTRVERADSKKVAQLRPPANAEDLPRVVLHTNQYTGIYRLLTKIYPQMGIVPVPVDLRDLTAVRGAVDARTKILFVETPANPTVDVIDLAACAEIAHAAGAKLIVDNTWASPALQRPLALGADLVVESLTKYINGHGDALGGAVISPKNTITDIRYFWGETFGPVMSPFNAWLILRGMRTLSMRMERHSRNALQVADFLSRHPKVKEVVYPGLPSHPNHDVAKRQMLGFSGMVGFELDSEATCHAFMNRLRLVKVGVSIGDTTSLAEWTPYMTGVDLSPRERKVMRISNTHIRFSVGLEDPADLIEDLRQALESQKATR